MTPEEYREAALRTEALSLDCPVRASAEIRGLHHAIGIATEAGELLDAFKKKIYYGKHLDLVNIAEEIGDLFWYINGMIDYLNSHPSRPYGSPAITWESIMENNIEKLRSRYPQKFTEEKAINRDISSERTLLERLHSNLKEGK